MCGINGFNWNDADLIGRMNEYTKRRGPDNRSQLVNERVSFGHNRLAIIDLSESANQPMYSEDKRLLLIYNGEIYNYQEVRSELVNRGYKFRTNSDSEVILYAYQEYGPDCLSRFNGMWAFCIYDDRDKSLFLARDQFGIKPLYYYEGSGSFIFSSMIGAILEHTSVPREADDDSILQYLAFNLEDHTERTFFRGIVNLPPTTYLRYYLDDRRLERHEWLKYSPVEKRVTSEEELRAAFERSVKYRLISDVPVGSCLSGGVDSSSIVCTMDKMLSGEFYTFSHIEPGYVFDESKYVRIVGACTKTRQEMTSLSVPSFLDDVTTFVEAQEEPVTGLSPYAQFNLMRLANKSGLKVLLDGQGGDEIFAGYHYYYGFLFSELWQKMRWIRLARELWHYLLKNNSLLGAQLFAFSRLPNFAQHATLRHYLQPWINWDTYNKDLKRLSDPRFTINSLETGLHLALTSTAIPHLLRWEDRNSMHFGIETRLPFLDQDLVDLARTLPLESKLAKGESKVIFKKALRKVVPPEIFARRDKIGFQASINEFIRNPAIRSYFLNIVNSTSFRNRPYWRWKEVSKLFEAHYQGRINIGDTIWKWINLELWHRRFLGA